LEREYQGQNFILFPRGSEDTNVTNAFVYFATKNEYPPFIAAVTLDLDIIFVTPTVVVTAIATAVATATATVIATTTATAIGASNRTIASNVLSAVILRWRQNITNIARFDLAGPHVIISTGANVRDDNNNNNDMLRGGIIEYYTTTMPILFVHRIGHEQIANNPITFRLDKGRNEYNCVPTHVG
jgi:hypothetical protein